MKLKKYLSGVNKEMDHYDIIIIGSGAGGGTLALALALTGKRILILERGGFLPREKENWEAKAVFLNNRYKTEELWYDKEGKPFRPGTHYYVGGNTKVYGAALLRLRKEDFEEMRHYAGISPKWPLSYEDFQPYYLLAEQLYYVHGQRGIDPTEPPEKSPFFYPPLPHEKRVQEIFDGMKKKGLHPFPLPLGLLRNETKPEKSPCIRCDTCDGFPCLVDAKADSQITCINRALQFPNVTLLTHTKALRLEPSSQGGSIQYIEVERENKKEKYSGDLFIVSCGAVNSAALLLKSMHSKYPSGLANSSGLVGRNYMCHINSAMIAFSKTLNETFFEKTFGLNDFYFGAPDWNYPLGHIQLLGNVKKDMLKSDAPFFTPNKVLETMANHAVGWWISSEDLPDPENRVVLTENGHIGLHYTLRNQEGHFKLIKRLKGILKEVDHTLGASPSFFFSKLMSIAAVAHQVGTCRFGQDPRTSVLDLNCKAHDLDNLYVVDGSFFPSSAAVNPALTIIANALRVSDAIAQRLKCPQVPTEQLKGALHGKD